MNNPLVWPRMNRSLAECRFSEISLSRGPRIDTDTSHYDFDGIGSRAHVRDFLEVRDQLENVASKFGFKSRHGYDQQTYPDRDEAREVDREFTAIFHDLTPMRWAEAGSREVWSWFSLALLPDLTHWRWKSSSAAKKGGRSGEWYKPRWIGSDLTRHTWARYWWRSVQFSFDPQLLFILNEHDFNHLLERADTLGANPLLLAKFGRRLWELNNELVATSSVTRRQIFDDSSRRMLRTLAYIDDIALDELETESLVDTFIISTKQHLLDE